MNIQLPNDLYQCHVTGVLTTITPAYNIDQKMANGRFCCYPNKVLILTAITLVSSIHLVYVIIHAFAHNYDLTYPLNPILLQHLQQETYYLKVS